MPLDKIINKISRVFNLKIYRWFVDCAKPYWLGLSIIIMINIFISISTVLSALASKQMVDLSVAKLFNKAVIYLVALASLYLFNIILGALLSYITVRISERMSNDIQKKIIIRLYESEWISVNRYHSGDILTRLTSDAGTIVNFWVSIFPSVISLFVQLVFAFSALLLFDKTLAIFAFSLGPVSTILGLLLGRKLKMMQHKYQESESKLRSKIQESIHNMLIIKTFNYEKNNLQEIINGQNERFGWAIKKNRYNIFANTTLALGYWIGYFAAFAWGAYRLALGLTSFGTFTAFIQLVGQVQGPFISLSRTLPQFISNIASSERLVELESLKPDKLNEEEIINKSDIKSLKLEEVTFSYNESMPILSNLNFEINCGEVIALVGSSGEGKTTLVRLLLSLLKPDTGNMYLSMEDGTHIKLSPYTRRFFTYVPQGNTLFSGSIMDNLRVGKEDLLLDELEYALKVSCAWEFVQSLPNKLDTVIGESGLGLSEGQAQRLAIARALLKKSEILLLDEATSALDIKTEREVLANIGNMKPRLTCIAVTHRLSVIDICDRVISIKDKKLMEEKK